MSKKLQNINYETELVLPYLRRFFNVLEKEHKAKMALKAEFPIENDVDITDPTVLKYIGESGEAIKEYWDRSVHGILNILKIYEEGYSEVNAFRNFDEFSNDEENFINTFINLNSLRKFNEEIIYPSCPFKNNGKDYYSTFLNMDGDGYWGYFIIIKPEEGAYAILKYTDPLMEDETPESTGFESVSYNFKTKELSFGSSIVTEE